MREYQLSEREKEIIKYIYFKKEKTNITQISKQLKMCYGNVLKIVNKLNKIGLINKEKEIGRISINISKKGKRLMEINK